ncbi:hypothetical protein Tco_0907339 [Tanacetum coccineum]|uniref:Uncharacterized protein n=1 Tax=Tanacetum coccineum TaxID=301880 RepID=A0ABQ5CK33_9ASTR
MHTVRGDGVAGIKRRRRDLSGDGVRNPAMALGRGRLKENIESSIRQRRQDFKATSTGAENLKRMEHDIVQDSIWEHDDDSKEDQEEDGDDGDTFDMWDISCW